MKQLEIEQHTDKTPPNKQVAKKDNMFKAIMFMNFFSIFVIANGSTFKIVHNTFGFRILDYLFLRNISMAIVTLILIWVTRADVWKLPETQSKNTTIALLVIRSLAGHVSFLAGQYSFLFAPVSILVVICTTNTFFISILAYVVNGEVMQRFEIGGLILCFVAVCCLSLTVNKRPAETEQTV